MSLVLLGLGTTTLGRTKRDENGNIVSQSPAQWEADPSGSSVIVAELDPETMRTKGVLSVFGDWAAAGYLARALELLQPNRPTNIPDIKGIIQRATKDGNGDILCSYCTSINCRDCIINEWKEEISRKWD